MNLGHPPLTFLNRKLILWGFLLFGQEIPPNSAGNPAAGPEDVADCNHASRLERRDFPFLTKSRYSILYWAWRAADLEGADLAGGAGFGADLVDLLYWAWRAAELEGADLAGGAGFGARFSVNLTTGDFDGGEDLEGDLPDFDLAGGAGFGARFLVDLTTFQPPADFVGAAVDPEDPDCGADFGAKKT